MQTLSKLENSVDAAHHGSGWSSAFDSTLLVSLFRTLFENYIFLVSNAVERQSTIGFTSAIYSRQMMRGRITSCSRKR